MKSQDAAPPPAVQHSADLCACRECGLLQRRIRLAPKQVAFCVRCAAELYHSPSNSLDHALALSLSAFILFLLANIFPILNLNIQGRHTEATLYQAVMQLQTHGMTPIAGLVLFTTLIVPAMELSGLLYVLAPLKWNSRLPGQMAVFRLIHHLRAWSMIEVFMLGVLVSLVKLSHMARIVPGWSLWLFGAFIFLMAGTAAALDPEDIWTRLGRRAPPSPVRPGMTLRNCHDCGWLSPAGGGHADPHCPRCGSTSHVRKQDSLNRSWALLVAAFILYIPANTLPIMYTSSILGGQIDTIMSGVVYLWASGSWPLALLVFFASIMVPLLKMIALALLLTTTQLRSRWRPLERTRLYRMTELLGRWSMVDIYVVTMLVALVDLRPLAGVDAGPGALAFGAVVVLTMLAAEVFDPRLIWDPIREDESARP